MIGERVMKLENTHMLKLTLREYVEDYKFNSFVTENMDFSILEKELNSGKTINIESTLFKLVDIIQNIETSDFENIELYKL